MYHPTIRAQVSSQASSFCPFRPSFVNAEKWLLGYLTLHLGLSSDCVIVWVPNWGFVGPEDDAFGLKTDAAHPRKAKGQTGECDPGLAGSKRKDDDSSQRRQSIVYLPTDFVYVRVQNTPDNPYFHYFQLTDVTFARQGTGSGAAQLILSSADVTQVKPGTMVRISPWKVTL